MTVSSTAAGVASDVERLLEARSGETFSCFTTASDRRDGPRTFFFFSSSATKAKQEEEF